MVRPGDTLVLRYAGLLTPENAAEIRDRALAALPDGAKVMIVDDDQFGVAVTPAAEPDAMTSEHVRHG